MKSKPYVGSRVIKHECCKTAKSDETWKDAKKIYIGW